MAACSTYQQTLFKPTGTENETDLITLNVTSSMRPAFTITLSKSSALRDIHLEVSIKTSLSRSFFKLSTETKPLPDNLSPITQFSITNGTTIYLTVNIQSGIMRSEVNQLTAAQKGVRSHVFQMKPEEISEFFAAKQSVQIRLPFPGGLTGTLKFKLDQPLSDDPDFFAPALERVFDRKGICKVQDMYKTSASSFKGKFRGDLPPEVFNSKGVPGKSVDTLVCILDNLIKNV